MKILADENIPISTAAELRELGHNVREIRGSREAGINDEQVWSLALGERRLLITTDKGFASRRSVAHFGVLIVRLRQPTKSAIQRRVIEAVASVAPGDWPRLLMIVRDRALTAYRSPAA